MIAARPRSKTYCGITDLLFNDQAGQISPKIPSGPNIFTAKIARLSQSRSMNLPLQWPENGHTASASKMTDATISSHATILSIEVSIRHT